MLHNQTCDATHMFKSRKIISINRKKPAICSALMRFATETSLAKVNYRLGKQRQRFARLRIAKDAESLEALPRFLQVVVMRRQHMSGLPKRNLKFGIVQIG